MTPPRIKLTGPRSLASKLDRLAQELMNDADRADEMTAPHVRNVLRAVAGEMEALSIYLNTQPRNAKKTRG